MIYIGVPTLEENDDRSRVVVDVWEDTFPRRKLWLEVPRKYASGLSWDRVDGFVVGLLGYAIQSRQDITFEAPITDALKDSITHDFIDVICEHQAELHCVKLIGPTMEPIFKANVIHAMGLSCGVDCMYTVYNRMIDKPEGSRYFLITDAHMRSATENETDSRKRFDPLLRNAQQFAQRVGIPLVVANTNWGPKVFDRLRIENNTTYCNCFAALLLQNLFSQYYIASGGPIVDFYARYLKNGVLKTDCSNYDLLSLGAFSTPALRFIVDGLERRVKKIRSLLEWPECFDNLDVCEMHYDGAMGNGTYDCHKCMHTVNEILSVGGMAALEKFAKVFDVGYVKSHRDEFLAYLICQRLERSEVGLEAWHGHARDGASMVDYVKAFFWIARKAIRKGFKRSSTSPRRWVDI